MMLTFRCAELQGYPLGCFSDRPECRVVIEFTLVFLRPEQ
jgi:hypothetical protein